MKGEKGVKGKKGLKGIKGSLDWQQFLRSAKVTTLI